MSWARSWEIGCSEYSGDNTEVGEAGWIAIDGKAGELALEQRDDVFSCHRVILLSGEVVDSLAFFSRQEPKTATDVEEDLGSWMYTDLAWPPGLHEIGRLYGGERVNHGVLLSPLKDQMDTDASP